MEPIIKPTTTGGAKRRRFTETERASHLSAWRREGGSAKAYGEAHGIGVASLYAWARKAEARPGKEKEMTGSPFIPVRITGGGTKVILRNGGLECVIEGAGEARAFAVLAGALKREVFDV